MKTYIYILLLLFCSGKLNAQAIVCDSALIFELRDLQISTADKIFKSNYFLKRETFPYDFSEAGDVKTDSAFHEVCTDIYYWDGPELKSTKVLLANPGDDKLTFYCTISVPIINNKNNKCRIEMLSFFGNWGSTGSSYYYRKRFGKWRLYKTSKIF